MKKILNESKPETKYATISTPATMGELGVACLICGECVKLSEHEESQPKVCDKCKHAIMHIRKQIEQPADYTVPVLD